MTRADELAVEMLLEIRRDLKQFGLKVEGRLEKMENDLDALIAHASTVSLMGYQMAARVEGRLRRIEQRLSALEARDKAS